MEVTFFITSLVIFLAFFFNFTNGFNDSSGQVATVISCRALQPETALTLAAIGNLAGAYFLGTNVARTIGKDIIDPYLIESSHYGICVLLSALGGAVSWNVISWFFGIPSSSSHALIGGLLGAFIAGWGVHPVQWVHVRNIIVVMLLTPLAGFGLTYLITKLTFFIAEWFSPKANAFFRGLQVLTLIFQSLTHGSNDAQKTMGVITFALIVMQFHHAPLETKELIPTWVILSSAGTMALGILIGGWRMIRLLGGGLYRVRPIHGFAAQMSSGAIMYLSSLFGFPVSTTQIISSSIMGAGAAFRPKSVRWQVAGDMIMAWLITIPVSAFIAALTFKLLELFPIFSTP